MYTPRRPLDLVLVVPFHNEERYLPNLVRSLRAQSVRNIPVVFIDNGSTDGSAALLRRCPEVHGGRWICMEERRVGKVYALKTATAFCVKRFGARYLGLIDADTYFGGSEWVRTSVELINDASDRLGYTYSPLKYFGFGPLPVFRCAYQAYEDVYRSVVENIGWLANGQGFVCSTDILTRYFERARVTTEFDNRCSLIAIAERREARFNPTPLVSSGRRIIVNSQNFASWCFYAREFYSEKDINSATKLNLNQPAPVEDLRQDRVGQFFSRRSVKIVSRHLLPLAVFDRNSFVVDKIKTVLGVDVRAGVKRLARRFRNHMDFLLTEQFEEMMRAIEYDPVAVVLAKRIENLMRDRHKRAATARPLPADFLGSRIDPMRRRSRALHSGRRV
jgi:glycosyltransferase involved in cell wall biosynthesis